MKGGENMGNNENPNYVLKFNETVRKTVKDTNYKIKIIGHQANLKKKR